MTTTTADTDNKAVTMAQATITDEMIADMRARAGVRLRIDHSVNHEETTRLAVARFAGAVGDPNPLWTDGARAAASPYGRAVAPPSWVIAAFSGIQFGWPGLGSFHSGSRLTCHRPVYHGDVIESTCTYLGFDGPKRSSFAPRIVIDKFTNEYRNQDGVLAASIDWSVINFERGATGGAKRDSPTAAPHRWGEQELEAIEAEVLAERERGSS